VNQHARNLAIDGRLATARFLVCDRDVKYAGPFLEVLVAAGVLVLRERVSPGILKETGAESAPQVAIVEPARRAHLLSSACRLGCAATCVSLALALLVGLRGEMWVELSGASWQPMARLSGIWGAASVATFVATLLLLGRRRRSGAAWAIVAAVLGFGGALLSGRDLGSHPWALPIHMRLADPAQHWLFLLIWLVAALPLVAAAAMALAAPAAKAGHGALGDD